MAPDVLQRFRAGIDAKRFTLSQVAEASGLSLTQLSYMKNSDWGEGVFDKAQKLASALDALESDPPAKSKTEQSREPVAN